MKKLLLFLIIVPMIGFGQTHSIDKYSMQMSGNTLDNDISVNTFYNAFDTCNISWVIIKDSMPLEWDFSFCFPDCYAQGVTSSQDVFYPGENNYLNCHIYPNGTIGEGIIQMEITTNNVHKDTVTWRGTITSISSVFDQVILLGNHNSNQVYDISGRKVNKKPNTLLFYIYDDGTVEKKIIIE
tara:strand:+ start:191 stop:739 length:549 start_codon:yes stop_codon:yes gene_type:complete